MPFQSLGITPALARAARGLGLTQPTAIQAQAITPILNGRDLLACAPTGSGKTAAYALPLLQRLLADATAAPPAAPPATSPAARYPPARRVRALVLVPTRELAAQVGRVFTHLAQQLPRAPQIAIVFGGVSINPQMMRLRGGADLVVATPGRLLDLVAQHALHLGALQCLVLDEADRLLDLGFSEELARVLALLPVQRQNLLFSATFEPAVRALADRHLHDPVRLAVAHLGVHLATEATPDQGPAGLAPQIAQRAIAVDAGQRTALLRHLVGLYPGQRMLVFVATRHRADMVAEKLYKNGIYAAALHGALSQGARQQVLDEFKAGRWDVLITTDLAARGIDIAELPIVLNYDLPRSATDYVHRIGRTGRAGCSGLAISLVSAQTQAHFRLIQKRQQSALALEVLAGFEPQEALLPLPAAAPGTGGIKGRRPSKKDKLRAAAQGQGPSPQR